MADEDLREYWRDVRAPPRIREYHGRRNVSTGKCEVTVLVEGARRRALGRAHGVMNHSPNGFEWGYSGSGPAQLALALLVDVLGKHQADRALALHQRFKAAVVVSLPPNEWTLTSEAILNVVDRLEGPGKGGDRGG